MSMLKPRRTRRQDIIAFNAADRFYAAAAGKAPVFQQAVPALRGPRVDHPDLEKHVIRSVSELIAVHPKVLFGVRQNSGGASYEAKSGKYAPIFFYHILTSQPVTITDFWGILRDGRPFALEAKRPSWKEPRETREMRQALFISLVQNCGGIGGFVRSSEEANEVLNGD